MGRRRMHKSETHLTYMRALFSLWYLTLPCDILYFTAFLKVVLSIGREGDIRT